MKLKNGLQLFLAAFIWGIAFVAQSSAADFVGPFTFNGIRCILGAIVLLPLVIYRRNKKQKSTTKKMTNKTIAGGFVCGLCLCLASILQQMGIAHTTAGKAGFITALYIVFVPVASAFFFHKKMTLPVIGSVILGVAGLFVMCIKEDFSLGKGDFYVLLCAFAFTAHILFIDYFSAETDGILLSCLQFFTCSILCIPFILLMERPQPGQILSAGIPILYAGILSCGVAYTLQIVGQKNMNPTIASLILSLESVVSVLAGWIILKQTLTTREILGCILMFIATITAISHSNEENISSD